MHGLLVQNATLMSTPSQPLPDPDNGHVPDMELNSPDRTVSRSKPQRVRSQVALISPNGATYHAAVPEEMAATERGNVLMPTLC